MYISTSLIIAKFINIHIIEHSNNNYCIYLHKILIEKTQLTIKNNIWLWNILFI